MRREEVATEFGSWTTASLLSEDNWDESNSSAIIEEILEDHVPGCYIYTTVVLMIKCTRSRRHTQVVFLINAVQNHMSFYIYYLVHVIIFKKKRTTPTVWNLILIW